MAPHTDHQPDHPRPSHGPTRLRRAVVTAAGALVVLVGAAVPTVSAAEPPSPRAAAPAPATAAEPTRVAATAARHLVRPGETLSGIAARHGVAVADLAAANGIADPDLVRHGVTLVVPEGGAGGGGDRDLPARLAGSPDRLALRPVMARWADANGIPTDLLEATTWLESGWQAWLVSPDGAVGIGQLMPSTVTFMEELIGVDLDPHVAEDNIRMAARYLRWLLARTTSVEGALAGYYQGLASVEANGNFGETDRYVANVLALRDRF